MTQFLCNADNKGKDDEGEFNWEETVTGIIFFLKKKKGTDANGHHYQ